MRTVHKVCTMLRRWDAVNSDADEAKKCEKCPAWEKSRHGKVVKGCRVKAMEFVNIVKTGNPWGAKRVPWPRSTPKEGSGQ